MTLFVGQAWEVKAGHYVNVWIPSVSPLASFQSHPFTIAAWNEGPTTQLDFLIQPRDGFTRALFECADEYQMETEQSSIEENSSTANRAFGFAKRNCDIPDGSDYRLALITGPHGLSVDAGSYGTVLIVASGFGIAAGLPILKELVQGFNESNVRTRHVHLAWQLDALGIPVPQPVLEGMADLGR